MIKLASEHLAVVVDPDHGSDLLSVTHTVSGEELLFRTPWSDQAMHALAAGVRAITSTTQSAWMGTYRGGWQLLCPNAGTDRVRNGTSMGYHGEASTVAWRVIRADQSEVCLSVELVSAPIRIERRIVLEGGQLRIEDELTNLSAGVIECDYVQHPAFGGAFLAGGARIETGARTFYPDDERAQLDAAGPTVHPALVVVPRGDGPEVFGWLTDFNHHWAAIHSDALSLTVRLTWDGTTMPHAWLWCELGSTRSWPWFGRGRAIAVEPASTSTSGPHRRQTLTLHGNETRKTWIALALEASV